MASGLILMDVHVVCVRMSMCVCVCVHNYGKNVIEYCMWFVNSNTVIVHARAIVQLWLATIQLMHVALSPCQAPRPFLLCSPH